jgi:hypothetical protein
MGEGAEAMSNLVLNCPRCSAVIEDVDWIDISAYGDAEPRYIAGRHGPCPTEGCGTTCPTCRRAEGDIHGAECGPVMARKVEDPTRVSREDCLAVIR